MSSFPCFFLRSNNGTGEIYLRVQGSTMTEICLFSTRFSIEHYPLDLRGLAIKSGLWTVKEVSAEVFQQAQQTFLQKLATLTPPPPTPEENIPAFLLAPAQPSPEPKDAISQVFNGTAQGEGLTF